MQLKNFNLKNDYLAIFLFSILSAIMPFKLSFKRHNVLVIDYLQLKHVSLS